jgi:putative thioredoxin
MDVTDSTFQSSVIERSHAVPVVVDFWAEWCGPCRRLGPVIERAVAQRQGKIELAKLDVDANPMVARTFRIQSIPAVMAFRDGKVVAEFVGAQPPAAVERFLDSLLPSEADQLIAQGDEESLRKALELDPLRGDAAVPLAKMLLTRGEVDEAHAIVERIPGNFAAEGLAARIKLERAGSTDNQADLTEAFRAVDAGDYERGLDLLLNALPSADGARDDIRRVVVGILDELGVEHPLARESRRRLASALIDVVADRLKARHPHPEQAHRTRRGKAPQQLARDRTDPIGGGHRLAECPRPGVGREVIEPYLDPDRASAAALGDERLAKPGREPVEDLLQARLVSDVVVERGLARLRDHLSLLRHRCLVLEPSPSLELSSEARTEASAQCDRVSAR